MAAEGWKPQERFLNIDPELLAFPPNDRPQTSDYDGPRLVKTDLMAKCLQSEWKQEIASEATNSPSSLGNPLLYHDEEGNTFYGHVARPSDVKEGEVLPGVIFFQTGAGPQDLYFHWKADILARKYRCIVLISDLLSDERGWGWDNDKTLYGKLRKELLKPNDSGTRDVLRKRIQVSLGALMDVEGVDPKKIAAFGWCLGGQCIVELARMQLPGIRCMAAFHGTYDGIRDTALPEETSSESSPHPRVLICNGGDDVFLLPEDVAYVKSIFDRISVDWSVFEFGGVKHSFTNAAMKYHAAPEKFAYDDYATKVSWGTAVSMLEEM